MIAKALANFLRHALVRPGPLDDWWYGPPGAPSPSGIIVKPDNALAVSTVFACVRALAETLSCLPYRVYERTGERTKRQAQDHPLWSVLHTRPNRWQTSFEWREMGMVHLCLRGNFYSRIWLNERGQIELLPLNPDRVQVEQLDNLSVRYQHRRRDGQTETLRQEEVHHVRGLSANGLTGLSVLDLARNAVGSAIAQETHAASLFRNGGLPAIWIKRPKEAGKWSPIARTNFREGWRTVHGGAENAGNPPILDDGMELHELGLSNRDSQFIESRGFSAVEICRFFRVPPHLVSILDRATFSNIEQQSLEFVLYTMLPWCVRWEQAGDRDLLADEGGEGGRYYTKLVLDGLLRGDTRSRYEAYNIGVQGGWLTRNEVRELEDRDPIDGGDVALEPLNMQPAGGGPNQQEQQGGGPAASDTGDAGVEDVEDDEPPRRRSRPARSQDTRDQAGERSADLKATFAPLVADAAARLASAEIRGLERRADKAADDPNRWAAFATEFYEGHLAYTARTLEPLCSAWRSAGGGAVNLNDFPDELLKSAAPAYDGLQVLSLLARWKTERAGELRTLIERTLSNAV